MPNMFELRADRKGRPYGVCGACGMRIFFRGANSLKGLTYLWGPLVRAITQDDRPAVEYMLKNAGEEAEKAHVRELAAPAPNPAGVPATS